MPAAVLAVAGAPVALLVLDVAEDGVHGVYSVTSPAKLARVR